MGDLTRNFSRSEFACQGDHCCGHSAPVSIELVYALQAMRDLLGRPLHLSSGFRCITHNREVDGVEDSLHTLGLAADLIIPSGMTGRDLAHMAEMVTGFRNGGIGVYRTWVHVDLRPVRSRWGDA